MRKSFLIFFQGKANSCLIEYQQRVRYQGADGSPPSTATAEWKQLLTCSYKQAIITWCILMMKTPSTGLRRPCATSSEKPSQDQRNAYIIGFPVLFRNEAGKEWSMFASTFAVRLKQPFGSTIFSRTKDLIPALLTYSYTTPCSRWVLSTVRLMRGVSSPITSGELMVCGDWARTKISH